jgi:two-component system response regulator MprA
MTAEKRPRPDGPPAEPVPGSEGGEPVTVLLVGEGAGALAPRLALSGYLPRCPDAPLEACAPAPGAVILAAEADGLIPALRQRYPGVPLLLGIASDSFEGRVHCLSCGADDFWITAIGPSDLLTRLRLHLGRRQQQRTVPATVRTATAPALRVADLCVDPLTREVRRGKRQLSLTAREYDLLLLLLEHSGSVVSREQILGAIWQEERPAASNVIEVYVRYLRQKLEQGGERRLIHTVRGRGYCLGEAPPHG